MAAAEWCTINMEYFYCKLCKLYIKFRFTQSASQCCSKITLSSLKCSCTASYILTFSDICFKCLPSEAEHGFFSAFCQLISTSLKKKTFIESSLDCCSAPAASFLCATFVKKKKKKHSQNIRNFNLSINFNTTVIFLYCSFITLKIGMTGICHSDSMGLIMFSCS